MKLSVVAEDESSEVVDGFVAADAVGHRIVHGGSGFAIRLLVDDDVVAALEALVPLAPLHNRPAWTRSRGARRAARTSRTWPSSTRRSTRRSRTRRRPTRSRMREMGDPPLRLPRALGAVGGEHVPVRRLVVCHLGGGSSVTAVLDGRSVDTTMGFTPLEGVPMTTRSGSVDPGALLYVQRERGLVARRARPRAQLRIGARGALRHSGDLREVQSAGERPARARRLRPPRRRRCRGDGRVARRPRRARLHGRDRRAIGVGRARSASASASSASGSTPEANTQPPPTPRSRPGIPRGRPRHRGRARTSSSPARRAGPSGHPAQSRRGYAARWPRKSRSPAPTTGRKCAHRSPSRSSSIITLGIYLIFWWYLPTAKWPTTAGEGLKDSATARQVHPGVLPGGLIIVPASGRRSRPSSASRPPSS